MIAGIVVAGFGLASVYAAPLTNFLIGSRGLPDTMTILGVSFLIVVVALAQLLKAPPAGYVPVAAPGAKKSTAGKEDYSPSEMLRTPAFYLMWFMYACGAGAGLMIIAKLAAIASVQAGVSLGFVLVASLALGNGFGRILAGTLSDRVGRMPTITGALLIQAVLMLVLARATTGSPLASVPALALLSALMGAN
jgi:OFA family oxalate/formate antiporter-like MFS transporter